MGKYHKRMFCLAAIFLTVCLGLMGVSYSLWNEEINVSGSVSTGDIDVCFTSLSISDTQQTPVAEASAEIADDGKTISVRIDNAYPGYSATLSFSVTNKGTIPVNYLLSSLSDQEGVAVTVSQSGGTLAAQGGTASGEILLSVNDGVQEKAGYDFSFELNFQQSVVK